MSFDDAMTLADELLKRFAHKNVKTPAKDWDAYHNDCWVEL